MSDAFLSAVARYLPVTIEDVVFYHPALLLIAPDWQMTIVCPWRLVRDDVVLTSLNDPDVADYLPKLVGTTITRLVPREPGTILPAADPELSFDCGYSLEVFADTDLDPWTLRAGGITHVGLRRQHD